MVIIDNRADHGVAFRKLSAGTIIQARSGSYFLKIHNQYNEFGYKNAVDLKTLECYKFDDEELVIPYPDAQVSLSWRANDKINEEYWCIVLNNFEGRDDKLFFENYDIARKNYLTLANKYKDFTDFEILRENKCCWFDGYSEWSTFVTLEKQPLPLYNEIIF